MKTYCLHHTDVPDRKKRLTNVFKRENIEVEWIEDFHPNSISLQDLDIRHNLNINAISVYLKHKKCLELQKQNNYKNILVFEDDILIPENFQFNNFLEKCMVEFEQIKGDLLFIGGAFHHTPSEIKKDQLVYSEPGFISRCAHAYVVSHRCLDHLLENIDIIDDALDWKINNIIKEKNLKVCYTEPHLKQSTVEGLEASTIQDN